MTIEDIARTCHEVHRAYCEAIGDSSQIPWIEAPDWQHQSSINGVRMALSYPDTTPQTIHESWMKEKIAQGWTYGEVKNAKYKTHPCLKPYNELPQEQRVKDYLFLAVAKSLKGAL